MTSISSVKHSYRLNLLPFLIQTHHWGALKPAMDIKTFVFLDSETTGLPSSENNSTRMTELCFTAVQADHIGLGVYPRIQSKVSLCFNPRKPITAKAFEITGLSNELLEHQPEFDAQACGIIQEFLNMQRRPICLVAHNGNMFHYPILRAEIHKSGNSLMDDVLCIDSLLAFRKLDLSAKASSFKLGDVYKRLTLKEPTDAHTAEADVAMLIECAATLGQNFVDWANVNRIRFCDIPMMTPGKPIGT